MASNTIQAPLSAMLPDWRNLVLVEGVLGEPVSEPNRLAVWLRGDRQGGFQHWERVTNIPNTEFAVERGICAAAASAVSARQRLHGPLGKLWQRFRTHSGNR